MAGALTQGLELAFDQLDDFVAVQSPLSSQDLNPVLCLWEAAGIGDHERTMLAERIKVLAGTEEVGSVALGVLVGLLAAQLSSG